MPRPVPDDLTPLALEPNALAQIDEEVSSRSAKPVVNRTRKVDSGKRGEVLVLHRVYAALGHNVGGINDEIHDAYVAEVVGKRRSCDARNRLTRARCSVREEIPGPMRRRTSKYETDEPRTLGHLQSLIDEIERMKRYAAGHGFCAKSQRRDKENDISDGRGSFGILLVEVIQERQTTVSGIVRERFAEEGLMQVKLIADFRIVKTVEDDALDEDLDAVACPGCVDASLDGVGVVLKRVSQATVVDFAILPESQSCRAFRSRHRLGSIQPVVHDGGIVSVSQDVAVFAKDVVLKHTVSFVARGHSSSVTIG